MSDEQRDWKGRKVAHTNPSASVPHWTCEPFPGGGDYDALAVRGWQDFLEQLNSGMEAHLDGMDESDLREGVTFTIKLEDHRPEEIGDGN